MTSDPDLVEHLKAHARVLHRRVIELDPAAIVRVRALRELKPLEPSAIGAEVQRRHCLATLASELGFSSWTHLLAVLERGESEDLGTLLCPASCTGHWNIWSAQYDEAREIRREHGGYLLGYKRQFLIVDRFYIESMGLHPDDPNWDAIGRDWIQPAEPAARTRLYRQLVEQTLATV